MACKTQCIKCGATIDKFSGKLINLSDEGLAKFYNIPYVREYCKQDKRKHVTLCSDCLIKLLGKPLSSSDLKLKNGRYMTSNIAYLLDTVYKLSEVNVAKLAELDKSGVLPYRAKDMTYAQVLRKFV